MPTADLRSRDVFATVHLTLAVGLLALAVVEAIHKHTLSTAAAYLYAAALAALTAAVPRILASPATLDSFLRWLPRVALAASSSWILMIGYAPKVDGWDEGAHMLSGLALRGYSVPYAGHRPPVASWLAAVFAGADFLIKPILLTLLLLSVYHWAKATAGPAAGAISVMLLLRHNLLLEASIDVVTELPAAVLLTILASISSRSRDRQWPPGCWFWVSLRDGI